MNATSAWTKLTCERRGLAELSWDVSSTLETVKRCKKCSHDLFFFSIAHSLACEGFWKDFKLVESHYLQVLCISKGMI